MAYPLPSDFSSASLDGAWWGYARDNGATNICATTGAALLRRLRGSLGLSSSPVWDDALQSALIGQASSLQTLQGSAWAPIVATMQSDLASRSVSVTSMTFAIYLAFYRASNLRLDAIGIPSGATMPRWGVTVADRASDSVSDDLVCFDPQQDQNPFELDASDASLVQQQSSTGIRLHPGESLPAPSEPLPAVPGVPGLIVGLIAVGITGFVFWFNAPKPRTRK